MERYALVKKEGITKKIMESEVAAVVDKCVKKAMLKILCFILEEHGKNYMVTPLDIEKHSDILCGGLASDELKKMINYNRQSYYNDTYTRIRVYDFIKLVLNKDIEISIDDKNFDYILKDLGVIEVDDLSCADSTIHKCGNCRDLSPLSCEKAEYLKKPISEYDFIVDGYQTYLFPDGVEHLDKFIVQRCRHFKIENTPITYISKPKIKTK